MLRNALVTDKIKLDIWAFLFNVLSRVVYMYSLMSQRYKADLKKKKKNKTKEKYIWKKGKINIFVWRQEADENTRDIWVIVLYYHVDAFKKALY